MAELHKTGRMLNKPLASTRNHLKNMLRRKTKLISSGYSLVKASTQAWLEGRYGFRPAMMEANGIIQSYAKVRILEKERRLVARSGIPLQANVDVNRTTSVPYINSIEVEERYVFNTVVSAGVIYDLRDKEAIQFWNHTLGLNLADVPAAIWDLVPYSFVVDWWLGVGQWLKAVMPKPYIHAQANWVTTKSHELSVCNIPKVSVTVPNTPTTTWTTTGGHYIQDHLDTVRVINQPLPSLPVFNGFSLSTPQVIDAASLVVARLNSDFGHLKIPRKRRVKRSGVRDYFS
jgi:hypothetical protein